MRTTDETCPILDDRPIAELVQLIHLVNHAWKRAAQPDIPEEVAAMLRNRKHRLQLELLGAYPERCRIIEDPETPGARSIRLEPPVPARGHGTHRDAAHIPAELVAHFLSPLDPFVSSRPVQS